MVATSITINSRAFGWLRGVSFDSLYIMGTLTLGLACGSLVIGQPYLFLPIFLLNGYLLGYHHVVSTFTRLTFDSDSFRQHRFLVVWLPIIVLGAVVLLSALLGVWILATMYLYWQWWHYTRQSYGVSRIYARKAGIGPDRVTTAMIYAVPVWGILYRSYQAPGKYLFAEVKVIPVPFWLVAVAGVFALTVTALWVSRQLVLLSRRELPVAHTAYLLSHLTGFTVAYLLIENINYGWLVLNVWHNSQYILTVWMFNNSRFNNEANAKHRFLFHLSQKKNVVYYFGVCLLISTVFYSLISSALSWASVGIGAAAALPLIPIVYQSINFHHYLVDAVIWKVRRKTVRENLGIAS
jgi:hypothetical protein